jgi:hypothetical protein
MNPLITRSLAALLILILLLFVPGSITWTRGWLFLLVVVTLLVERDARV